MPARSQPSKRGSSPAIFEMSIPAKSITPRRSSRSMVLSSIPIWSSGVMSALIAPFDAFGSVSRQNGTSSTIDATVGALSPITLNCVLGNSCATTENESRTATAPRVRASMAVSSSWNILLQCAPQARNAVGELFFRCGEAPAHVALAFRTERRARREPEADIAHELLAERQAVFHSVHLEERI